MENLNRNFMIIVSFVIVITITLISLFSMIVNRDMKYISLFIGQLLLSISLLIVILKNRSYSTGHIKEKKEKV